MSGHIGEKVKIASRYNAGVINDHLEISPNSVSEDTNYNGYLRKDFYFGFGPEDFPSDIRGERRFSRRLLEDEGKRRDWQKTSTEFENLSLDEALATGQEIAERENVVLYLRAEGGYNEIKWHPDGWEPELEPERAGLKDILKDI